ncbi:hypothetical protein FRUB_04376 [Fimbriiglobus ruber]|uniref:Uncharacterized protein n=1 Tax=Fimbriiglobus ruber TaxID=1908690 RepID=A0A225DUU2_9BACT|nr:hypothetical protein FRUB_04376 [Fimbriiglobus ruber]
MIHGPLLVGESALNRVDDNHGVQIVQHSRSPRRSPAARSIQFPVSLGIIGQARVIFGSQFRRRPPGVAAGALLRCDFPDHVRQAALWPTRSRDTDRHSHGAGRQSRLVCQSQLTV